MFQRLQAREFSISPFSLVWFNLPLDRHLWVAFSEKSCRILDMPFSKWLKELLILMMQLFFCCTHRQTTEPNDTIELTEFIFLKKRLSESCFLRTFTLFKKTWKNVMTLFSCVDCMHITLQMFNFEYLLDRSKQNKLWLSDPTTQFWLSQCYPVTLLMCTLMCLDLFFSYTSVLHCFQFEVHVPVRTLFKFSPYPYMSYWK